MNIITGKGNKRQVLALPHASAVKAAPVEMQRQVLGVVCSMLNVKEGVGGYVGTTAS